MTLNFMTGTLVNLSIMNEFCQNSIKLPHFFMFCCNLLKHAKYMETEGKNSLNVSFMGIKKSHFV